MQPKFEFEVQDIKPENIEDLSKDWLLIESKASNSVFTSWAWISTWLNQIDFHAEVIRVSFDGAIVGICCVCKSLQTINGFSIPQLWVNRTGDDVKDQIWSEYNDVLCIKGHEYSIKLALIKFFKNYYRQHLELIIGVCNSVIGETPDTKSIHKHLSWRTKSYSRTLVAEYANIDNFLKVLSSNSRRQIKRSFNIYGGLENIKVEMAQSGKQALEFFKEAGDYHKARWQGKSSGYNNAFFVQFHEALISNNFDNGMIDLIKISTDGMPICYLYNFVYKDIVYFYLSGISYTDDNKLKPGLVAHSIAISHYAKLNKKVYDFMGGEGRYKSSLSDSSGEMVIYNFRRNTLGFLLGKQLRILRDAFK